MKQRDENNKKEVAAMRKRRPPRATYHHGDLREALLTAAERVLERDGLGRFTLRACAREAGVSHAAPAHHFRDLADLTSALAARAFMRLSAAMDRCALEAAPDLRAMLPAMGLAWIDFALRHPGLYRLMFRTEALNAADATLLEASGACRERLTRAVRALLEADAPKVGDDRVRDVSTLTWSAIHGFASLAVDGHLSAGGQPPRRRADTLDLAGRLLLLMQPAFAPESGTST